METVLMDKLTLLQTFPGWPAVTDPSPMFYFMLCLGGPLLLCLVVAGLGLGLGGRRAVAENERAAGLTDPAEHAVEQPHLRRALPEGASAATPSLDH